MRTRIVRIGNSQGIRVPRPLLDQVGLGPESEVELSANRGALVVKPLRHPRAGWAEAFSRADAQGLLDPVTTPTRFDTDEWSW